MAFFCQWGSSVKFEQGPDPCVCFRNQEGGGGGEGRRSVQIKAFRSDSDCSVTDHWQQWSNITVTQALSKTNITIIELVAWISTCYSADENPKITLPWQVVHHIHLMRNRTRIRDQGFRVLLQNFSPLDIFLTLCLGMHVLSWFANILAKPDPLAKQICNSGWNFIPDRRQGRKSLCWESLKSRFRM